MTVRELIEQLQTMDPNLDVISRKHDGVYDKASKVRIRSLKWEPNFQELWLVTDDSNWTTKGVEIV